MQIKYGTDEYGNVYTMEAQIEPVGGTVCFNPSRETLDEPIAPDEGKRLIVENGKWKQIAISLEHTTETKDTGIFYRPKSQIERYATGIDVIPKGMKLSTNETTGEKELVSKTLEEQLKSGEILQSEYNTIYNQPIKIELNDIDIKSIRSLREWLLKQSDCPEFIKTYEEQATKKRAELKK